MSKLQRLSVSNLKAVSAITADFNGCSCIITGRNNSGKSSFLRSLPDRLRGIKPEIILKHDEHDGFAEWTLTTGERLRWEFTDRTKAGEKLIYISEKEIKGPLTAALCAKFFPQTFDVDKFLQSAPKEQRKTLQALVGLDFTDIDKRYKEAYDERENINRSARESKIKFDAMPVPAKVDKVDIDALNLERDAEKNRLNVLYKANKQANDDAKKKYDADKYTWQCGLTEWTTKQAHIKDINATAEAYHKFFVSIGYGGTELSEFIYLLPAAEVEYSIAEPTEPSYPDPLPSRLDLDIIENKITEAHETNRKHDEYNHWLKAKEANQQLQDDAIKADAKVKEVEKERLALIQTAKMPEGFTFADDGILYMGLPFTKEQQSLSGLYVAGLRLASMRVGEVRTIHFDASALDKNSLLEIEAWANEQDLQLLIERPDFEGGEITYELIETV